MTDDKRLVKRNIKDTVFSKLFEDPQNQLELYRFLHPEDKSVAVNDCKTVTIENVLLDQIYNDLGFIVRNRLLMLTEAQSTWSLNIIPRILMYLADTLNRFIHETNQSPYRRRKLKIPRPEFYVIYTGNDKKIVNKFYTLADEFFDGNDSFINVKVRVLLGDDNSNSIVAQYVKFTRVLADQEKIYGRKPRAIKETIAICKANDILRKFFEKNEKEVIDIMSTLYDDEELNNAFMRDRDIERAIKTCRDLKLTEPQIKEYIMKTFDLSADDAEDYLAPIPA